MKKIEIDALMNAVAKVNPVTAREVAGAAHAPGALKLRSRILSIEPLARRTFGVPRVHMNTGLIAIGLGVVLMMAPLVRGGPSAVSAVRGVLGFENAPAANDVRTPPASVSEPSLTRPTTSQTNVPPAVSRLVELMTERPGGVPDDQLPGAPSPGSTRLALDNLGALHRSIWLATTDRGNVCLILLTGDRGGGGCTAHFTSDLPITTAAALSDPAANSGDAGPAFLYGLAKSDVTAIDVRARDGAITPATLSNSAWYWETAPGPQALRDVEVRIHLASGAVQTVSLAHALGDMDPAILNGPR